MTRSPSQLESGRSQTPTEESDLEDELDIIATSEKQFLTSSKRNSSRLDLSEDFDPSQLRNAKRKSPGYPILILGIAILFSFGYLISFVFTKLTRFGHGNQVSVILCVSDGFGPASESFARQYMQHLVTNNHPSVLEGGRWYDLAQAGFVGKKGLANGGLGMLPLDTILVGSSRTRSANSLVTDSAAGATAFSCGMKSYNGAIAVEPEKGMPCGTVLEAARHQGYRTGLVTTSRLTHATPACFYAHVVDRDMESDIARFLVGKHHPLGIQVDLAFGGGSCFFYPNTSTTESCRIDDLDLMDKAKLGGLKVIQDKKSFDALPVAAKSMSTIGLFNRDHLNYEVDRLSIQDTDKAEPSLKEMSIKALDILQKGVEKTNANGFFTMIEGARIDMGAHSNDPVAHVYDILAYQETILAVKDWVDKANEMGNPTIMISVSDHETGGLSLAKQLNTVYPVYAWYPDALVNATQTSVFTVPKIQAASSPDEIRNILQTYNGISDITDDEVALLQNTSTIVDQLDYQLSTLISNRAQIGWSTHGHSGVDVNLYAHPRSLVIPDLIGNVENTDIGAFIAKTMSLDLAQTTKELNRDTSWHTTLDELEVSVNKSGNSQHVGVMHYHHEH